jgi:hypothetical protein
MNVKRFIGRGSKLVPQLKQRDIKQIIDIVGEYGVWPQLVLGNTLLEKAQMMFELDIDESGNPVFKPAYPGFTNEDAFNYSMGFTWPLILVEAAILSRLGEDVNSQSGIGLASLSQWNTARSRHINTVKTILRDGTGIYAYARQNPPKEYSESTTLGFHVGMAAAEKSYATYISKVQAKVYSNFGKKAFLYFFAGSQT